MPTEEILIDLRERMVRIETKFDSHAEFHSSLKEDQAALVVRVDDHEARIQKLESWQKLMFAAGAALMFLITFLKEWLFSRFA